MLYELVATARISDTLRHTLEAREVASTIGRLIIQNRGVVRKIQGLGKEELPKILSKDQERHFQGHRFLMLFDSSTAVQSEILRTLKSDPRVLRSLIVKVNDKRLANSTSLNRQTN
jgi:small subunit ribosomal protein S6